jgi:hypothetical protein
MAKRQRDPAKEQFWRQVLGQWQRSGATIRGYCARRQLSEASFHAWRRELARRDRTAAKASATFVPVQILTEPMAAIEIVLPDGITVRVGPGFDRPTFGQVMAVLTGDAAAEGASC